MVARGRRAACVAAPAQHAAREGNVGPARGLAFLAVRVGWERASATDRCAIRASEGIDDLMPKVLYIGDSETVISRYAVGADVFEQSYFNDNGNYLRNALAGRETSASPHLPGERRR